MVPSHLTYFQYDHMSLYGQALSLIPLANLLVVRGGYVWSEAWIGQDPGVCGRLVGVEPRLGVGYDRAVSGR